ILLIGQAAFGANVLEKLMERNENVVAVYAPPDRPGGRTDPLKDAAVSGGIDVFQPTTYKDDQVFSEYDELKPDLTIMAFVTDIIPARFFEVPTQGTINYHPSLLPRHRGASAINWAVIMGDTKTGLNIFWPDGGIDTGPILLQKEIDIGPDDTTGSIYFNHLYPMGVDAILESIDLIKAGNAPKIPQDEAGATYEPPCDDRVAGIDWDKPAGELYNLVRGCDPQPGAFALFKGEKTRFYGAKLIEEAVDKTPGTILDIDDQGIHVAVSGGRLVVGKVRPAKGGKVAASDFAAEQGIKSGDMFDR
ncbi:MAG: methionyl-tRNA formyltransferase, partial [Deltaproteobacteria bacterium]|nr:methionyl-tRNA formyltransferase [Deltaproteobacteria bacterium]